MKKGAFVSCVVLVNLLFIFLQIHKSTQFIKVSYEQQKFERIRNELNQEKERLNHQLSLTHNRSLIKEYAQKIGMKPVRCNQIKHITST